MDTSYIPESYTYTSVSGNGMTFGKLRKDNASYASKIKSTNKGQFLFFNLNTGEYDEIYDIVLRDEAEQADRTAIASYMYGNTIELVDTMAFSHTSDYVKIAGVKSFEGAAAMNRLSSDITDSRSELSKLETIKKWICGKI